MERYSDSKNIGDTADTAQNSVAKIDSAILEAPVVPLAVALERVVHALCHTCQSQVEFTPKTACVAAAES